MKKQKKPTYEELEVRLKSAEDVIEALRNKQVDAVIAEDDVAFIRVRETEKKLRDSEKRAETMIRNAPLGIGIVDESGNLIGFNNALLNILGYDSDELTGKNFADFTHPDDLERERKYIQKMWEKETDFYRMEKRYIRKDGAVVWVNVSASVIMEEGELKFGFAFVQDISKRKRNETKLREYSEHLEEMVEERTRELQKAQADLLMKERLAVLGHFAGSISHELRNPLAVIDSAVYLLSMRLKDNEKVAPVLERISRNVQKSTAIIQSLLNLSRMQKPKTVKTNLVDVVLETLASSKIPPSVAVIQNTPEQAIMVDIEIEQIRMALKNIVRNAVQAMDGNGKLTVSAKRLESGQVELTIADTGPGIAPEHLEKVFEPLFSTKTHGIGFGLSITKMIIENHGGTIRAESKPDQGAAFKITLPVSGYGG